MAADLGVTVLPTGAHLIALPSPAQATATVAVFVRSGSAHETRLINGISHVVEHMLFKGTASRAPHRPGPGTLVRTSMPAPTATCPIRGSTRAVAKSVLPHR